MNSPQIRHTVTQGDVHCQQSSAFFAIEAGSPVEKNCTLFDA